ncbi:hypothetical protein ACIRBZ_40585 [Streptomyces sp. NPDC094038]|uniref:hypothetical protein n=1 Tax=Streptomyces sp. NPDC094038 TaxID=3366055 RepID=UPI003829088D
MSQELLDAMDRHGRDRVAQVRDPLAGHPDVRVRDVGTAGEPVVFTVATNTHKLMADPRTIPVGTSENGLVDLAGGR